MDSQIGKKARDRITGFEGVITGRSEYITSCDHILLQLETDDKGSYVEGRWFDEGRIMLLGDGVNPAELVAESEKPGGPMLNSPPPVR